MEGVCGAHFDVIVPGNTASFEEMSLQWRSVGNTLSDLIGPRLEPQTSRSGDERVLPLDRLYNFNHCKSFVRDVSNVAYQYTGIASIRFGYVSFQTPCIYFLTNFAQKYHEQIG